MENKNYKNRPCLEKERKANKVFYCCFYCLMLTFFCLDMVRKISEFGGTDDFMTIYILVIDALLAGLMVFGFVYLIKRNNLTIPKIVNFFTLCAFSLRLIVISIFVLRSKASISSIQDYTPVYLLISLYSIAMVGLIVSVFFKHCRKKEVISNCIALGSTLLLLLELLHIIVFNNTVYIPFIVQSVALTVLLPSYFFDIKMQFYKADEAKPHEDENR